MKFLQNQEKTCSQANSIAFPLGHQLKRLYNRGNIRNGRHYGSIITPGYRMLGLSGTLDIVKYAIV